MTIITQIVPRLPPAIDGVGDYAWLLAEQLRRDGVLQTRFLVTDPHSNSTAGVLRLATHSATALADALMESETVLLHFVNYAYHKRGCPWWLVLGLERWRRARTKRRLLVMFHELYAFAAPWRSAFWLSPMQRMITRRLCRLSDGAFTSLELYARWLWGEARPQATWPVLSNVGEPSEIPALLDREPALVVFGRSSNREQIYRENIHQLRALARQFSLRTLHDIGAPLTEGRLPSCDGLHVVQHGILPASKVSELLLRCRVGLINNGGKPLGKSGVFAAYCSHGVVTLSSRSYPDADDLRDGRDYLGNAPAIATDLQGIAGSALAWYRRHDSVRLGQAVAQLVIHGNLNASAQAAAS